MRPPQRSGTRNISVLLQTSEDTSRSVQVECRIDGPPGAGAHNDPHSLPRCPSTSASAPAADLTPLRAMPEESPWERCQAVARARRTDDEEYARKLLNALVGALAHGAVCFIVVGASGVVDIVVWGAYGVLYRVRAFIVVRRPLIMASRPVRAVTGTHEGSGILFTGAAAVFGCISQLSRWPRKLLGHLRARGPTRFRV